MADISKNLLVKGARGNVGKQFVYRKHGDDTIITLMPVFDPDAPSSEEQQETRNRFAAATCFARNILQSADYKKAYRKKATKGKTAHNIAIRDFLRPPVVKKIRTADYNGMPGSSIIIHAKDDFRVAAVKVSIFNADGTLLEEGHAFLSPVNLLTWTYTATQTNAVPVGSLIRAVASDIPGNTAALEVFV
ncbi:hypothetical protein [Chitinophaga barathri]|uniref:Uncharacterized protein n=1 Tax=Chitinophaga barathri TaxID=1647451 RepID=A0A3N4M511_9BACT|nr:hypothetical protein [Chitinophaga barathri]RPD38261.1 hypothetical protein EG028_25535 [Chitinophaga barathri]